MVCFNLSLHNDLQHKIFAVPLFLCIPPCGKTAINNYAEGVREPRTILYFLGIYDSIHNGMDNF